MATINKIGDFVRKTANKAWTPSSSDIPNATDTLAETKAVESLDPQGKAMKDSVEDHSNQALEKAGEKLGNEGANADTKGNMSDLVDSQKVGSDVGLSATGVVGYTLKNIDKNLIEDDKFYVLKNDKVIHEFVKEGDAKNYAAVHQGSVNKGSTLKHKVA